VIGTEGGRKRDNKRKGGMKMKGDIAREKYIEIKRGKREKDMNEGVGGRKREMKDGRNIHDGRKSGRDRKRV